MRIFTSYFGIANKFPSNFTLVSIALKTPPWFKGEIYQPLTPSKSILSQWKQTQNQAIYTERYTNEILNNLDFNKVLQDLSEISSENDNVVLLCYEKSGDPCHRHIVAKWLREHGVNCTEISI